MSFSGLFGCTRAPGYTDLLRLVSSFGWRDRRVTTSAWTLWNGLDSVIRSGITPSEKTSAVSQGQEAGDFARFSWRTNLQVTPGVDVWLLRTVALMGSALLNSSILGDPGPWDCSYGFLAVQYALLVGFQVHGLPDLHREMSSQIIACMEVLLDSPYHTFDFFESSAWNVSSHDMAVNLDTDVHYPTFAAYEKAHPLPAPRLPPWHVPAAGATPTVVSALPGSGALEAAHVKLLGRPLTVALLQLHDGTAAELWASVQAACRTLAGVGATFSRHAGGMLQPRFLFTQVKALRGTTTGELLAGSTVVPFQRILDIKLAANSGTLSLSELRDVWLPREAPSLATADLLICSEPFWLCPLVAAQRSGWMLGVLHMALLNEFPFSDEPSLSAFWPDFYSMARRSNVLLSVACRLTAEQVLHQTGAAVPYVPFLGLHVAARHSPATARRALLFRNNRQHMLAFRGALRLFIEEIGSPYPVEIVDMNEAPRALSFEEIASYHAVVLLPHGPNALRLSDLYAAAVPMVVPGQPLVHKFIWASRTFGGYDAEGHYRARAPEALRTAPHGAGHPPFSPFNFLQAWAIYRFIDDRRYWYQYTEWATLPHLLRFRSLPELLEVLEALTLQEARSISARMAQHHVVMAADALGWWRASLSELLAHVGEGSV